MKSIFAGAALAALSSLPAAAATIADLCPKGTVAIIRVNTLRPGGTRAGFDKAVKDQLAWYRAHGLTRNRIVIADVTNGNDANPALSSKEIATIHYDPPSALGMQPPSDDGYKAFVKQYRDNSDITVEKEVCLPK